MLYLFIVSIIWAFSFGIIKDALTGLNPNIVAFVRLAISFMLFAPLLRLKDVDRKLALKLIGIGAVQYGLMYITYIYSFQYLKSFQVALFTIFTPLYVTLIYNVYQKHFYKLNFFTTLLTIAGTAIVNGQNLLQWELWVGFLFVQASNICFAYGQIAYKQLLNNKPHIKDQHIFALLYLGAVLITAISSLIFADWGKTVFTQKQILALLYLGLIASGVGFFLWNFGARRTNAGALAIFNDLKIPLAVTVSLLVFGEKTNVPNLLIGGAMILTALAINEVAVRRPNRSTLQEVSEV